MRSFTLSVQLDFLSRSQSHVSDLTRPCSFLASLCHSLPHPRRRMGVQHLDPFSGTLTGILSENVASSEAGNVGNSFVDVILFLRWLEVER